MEYALSCGSSRLVRLTPGVVYACRFGEENAARALIEEVPIAGIYFSETRYQKGSKIANFV